MAPKIDICFTVILELIPDKNGNQFGRNSEFSTETDFLITTKGTKVFNT